MQIAELEYQLDDSILTQRTLRLRIGATDVRIFMDQAAVKLRSKVSVPGFRKGRGPLPLIRKHYRGRIAAEAFGELKRAALDQVYKQLKDEDQPFIPPEVLEEGKIKLRYGQPLEFAVKYLVDPSGMGKQPEQPSQFNPLGQLHHQQTPGLPIGVPAGPRLPTMPTSQQLSGLPKLPNGGG